LLNSNIIWPDGKKFAFTVFDDTDAATLGNVQYLYSFLADQGFRTTKSVWSSNSDNDDDTTLFEGSTCDEPDYLSWLYELEKKGFELGWHGNASHSSKRMNCIRGLKRFNELFGYWPKSYANHLSNAENIYWSGDRLSGFNTVIYNLLTRYNHYRRFQGHVETSEYFWGDHCRERIKYVRNFVFREINSLKVCPYMPYHDSTKPYVNYWFASSEGGTVKSFSECLSEKNQDILEEQGGACIMYTHFGQGFAMGGKIDTKVKSLMERLARKNGWFVPVSTMLDYILKVRGHHDIAEKERKYLERKWLMHKILVGAS
jgi:hypothetical protein